MIIFSVKVGAVKLSRDKGSFDIHHTFPADVSSIKVNDDATAVSLVCKGEQTIGKSADGKYPEGYIYDHDAPDKPSFVVCKVEYEVIISADVIQAINEQMAIHGEKGLLQKFEKKYHFSPPFRKDALKFRASDPFPKRRKIIHIAKDIKAKAGSPVRAKHDGRVTR